MSVKMVIMALFMGTLLACNKGGDNTSSSLVSITITPVNPSITLGMTQQFTATGTYSDSAIQELTASVTWASSDTAIATVDGAGLAMFLAAGSTTITATSGGISGSTTLTVRDLMLESPFGIQGFVEVSSDDPNAFNLSLDAGVKWIRLEGTNGMSWDLVDPANSGNYSWTRTDQLASKLASVGFKIIWTVKSYNRSDQTIQSPCNMPKAPNDMNAYKAFIGAAAGRYHGVVDYWMIENEVDGNFWCDTAAKYAELVKASYEAIKAANPNAKIVLAGASNPGGFNSFYVPVLDALQSYGSNYFDVVDLHWYGQVGEYRQLQVGTDSYVLADFMENVKAKLISFGNPEIWFTETGTYSGSTIKDAHGSLLPAQNESVHGAGLIKRYIHFLGNGAQKVFWHNMQEGTSAGPSGGDDYFTNIGMIYNGAGGSDLGAGKKKLAYYSYMKMTELLEGSDWNSIQTIREDGDVYIYKFMKNDQPIYVAWWDYFNDPTYTPGKTMQVSLSGLQGSSAVITEAVPKFATGAEVTDYSTAFSTSTLTVSNGVVTLNLGKNPVFVETLQ